MEARIDSRKFKKVSRRELLKLAPVLAVGAFAIPKLQEPLLKAGLGFSDWASALCFAPGIWHHFYRLRSDPVRKVPHQWLRRGGPRRRFRSWTLT